MDLGFVFYYYYYEYLGRLHVLSLLHVEKVFALHGLLQQRAILQHQRLDLVLQMSVLFLQVSFYLTQQLTQTQTWSYEKKEAALKSLVGSR